MFVETHLKTGFATSRGDAAAGDAEILRRRVFAATRTFRGDESRRRRGRDVDIPRRCVAPRPRRGHSEETSRGAAAAATWTFGRDRRASGTRLNPALHEGGPRPRDVKLGAHLAACVLLDDAFRETTDSLVAMTAASDGARFFRGVHNVPDDSPEKANPFVVPWRGDRAESKNSERRGPPSRSFLRRLKPRGLVAPARRCIEPPAVVGPGVYAPLDAHGRPGSMQSAESVEILMAARVAQATER